MFLELVRKAKHETMGVCESFSVACGLAFVFKEATRLSHIPSLLAGIIVICCVHSLILCGGF